MEKKWQNSQQLQQVIIWNTKGAKTLTIFVDHILRNEVCVEEDIGIADYADSNTPSNTLIKISKPQKIL